MPLLVVSVWAFLTAYLHPPSTVYNSMGYNFYDDPSNSSLSSDNDYQDPVTAKLFDEEQVSGSNQSVGSCPFLVDASMHSEWAYKAPMLLILACNMVFLIYIMTVS